MFTSRAEYRMRLRQDNADRRLTPGAAQMGLVGPLRRQRWQDKEDEIARVIHRLKTRRIEQVTLATFLKRPEASWDDVVVHLPELVATSPEVAQQVVYDIKYAGYVARQDVEIARQKRLANKPIPDSIDYDNLPHLRTEAREKLSRVRPISLAQAARISGITPADIALLTVYMDRKPRSPKTEPST
jgi:tRNA uridine 5-carboxymethylaminomethyl modification enzyme